MKTLEWNLRTTITVGFALLLAGSVGAMGLWLLLSGQPGTGMMEDGNHTRMMENGDMAGMMGPPADRGILGGYTGAIGLIMIVLFVAMVALMLYALFRERPGQAQPAVCGNCERPVETDWTSCPYCGVTLHGGSRPPQTLNAP